MTTVDQMITRIELSMQGSTGPPEIDVLNGAINSSVTTLTITNGVKGVRVGAILEINYELMRVTAVASLVVTVMRAQYGSTAASHSSLDMVSINPRQSRMAIMQNMEEEIRAWPNEVFRVANEEVTISDTNATMAYNFLTSSELTNPQFLHVIRIQRKDPLSALVRWGNDRKARVLRQMDVDDHPSGLCLQLVSKLKGFTQYNVTYALKFDVSTFAAPTNMTTTMGIPQSFEDIIEYGVMGRLLVGKEARRIQRSRQGQTRSAQDVREGATFQTGSAYRQMADQRLAAEAKRLRHDWPTRIG